MNREDWAEYIRETYGALPEYLWQRYPQDAVFRHQENRKWFALLMQVNKEKLGLEEDGKIDVLTIKTDPMMAGSLCLEEGIFPGYHMNKGNWITILLEGTVPEQEIKALLEMSFQKTMPKKRNEKRSAP